MNEPKMYKYAARVDLPQIPELKLVRVLARNDTEADAAIMAYIRRRLRLKREGYTQ